MKAGARAKKGEAEPARAPRLLYLAKRWYAATRLRLDEITRPHDLTAGDYTMLSFLKRMEPCSAAELSREQRVTPQAATQQVAQLKAKGMVTSEENQANRRISLISMTSLGRTSLAAISAEARLLEEEMMAGLSGTDRNVVQTFLVNSIEAAEKKGNRPMATDYAFETVKVTLDDGIAWVALNRPAKRNAMSPTVNREMQQVLDDLELDGRAGAIVLTGEGEAFSAGMDLKEYFRETEGESAVFQARVRRAATDWMWRRLMHYPKPTIAMVNGWCFGGAFTPLVACDLAIAADEATFGLSEINWGIIPAGNVTRAVAQVMNHRDSLYYIMTGEPFDGRKAAEMGLVNRSVPLAQLRDTTEALARTLLSKNPTVLRHAKSAFKFVERLDWDTSEAMLGAMAASSAASDPERGRRQGMAQFLDEKSYRPGLESYRRED